MKINLPETTEEMLRWGWEQYDPQFKELAAAPLTAETAADWVGAWSQVAACLSETYQRLYVAVTANTADADIEKRFNHFIEEVYPKAMEAQQQLKLKLLDSGLTPAGMELPLRNFRAEVALFREENLPLLTEEQKLNNEYGKITGAQTVEWKGKELTIYQLRPVLQEAARAEREEAWRKSMQRQLADRQKINDLWAQLFSLRQKIAGNAGMPDDYRSYRWQEMLRFDYTPADCERFAAAIEEAVVSAARRIYERRRQQLGVDQLRPWDLDIDPLGRPALRPFQNVSELKHTVHAIFQRVHPDLGDHFETMINEDLLDLDNRKNKAPGGYCTNFDVAHRPFIFMNAVGTHDDVQTLLHEGGHSFHVFETARLPYIFQLTAPMEFCEVASMGMELLASPYLTAEQGGFYTEKNAARARIQHLESCILFWPYMAVVDGFQQWAYTHPAEAVQAEACDATWSALWKRFMPGVDWSGLEDALATGWQRKLHITTAPFYYVEYGLAQLGAVQVWRNALKDQAGAVTSYRRALALGGTASLPRLFEAAGARLAFDAATLSENVKVMEETISMLESD